MNAKHTETHAHGWQLFRKYCSCLSMPDSYLNDGVVMKHMSANNHKSIFVCHNIQFAKRALWKQEWLRVRESKKKKTESYWETQRERQTDRKCNCVLSAEMETNGNFRSLPTIFVYAQLSGKITEWDTGRHRDTLGNNAINCYRDVGFLGLWV